MKALVIARREFLGTRNLWLGAAFMGLFAMASPWFLGRNGQAALDVRIALSIAGGLGFALVVGLLLGAGMFGSDLSQRRTGFFLSRPVGAASLYFGKLTGVWLTVVLGAWLVFAPLLILQAGVAADAGGLLAAVVLLALLSILVGHAGSIILRARSPWLILDLATLGVFTLLVWTTLASLLEAGAIPAAGWLGAVLFGCVLAGLFLAGLMQVSRGRADLHASHRVLSLVLACTLLPGGLAAWLAGWNIRHPSATSLKSARVLAVQPGGSWVMLSGRAQGYWYNDRHMLLNTATGRHFDLGFSGGLFSGDGKRFLWEGTRASSSQNDAFQIRVVDFTSDQLEFRDSTATLSGGEALLAASRDGTRFLTRQWDIGTSPHGLRLKVYDADSGRRLAAYLAPHSGQCRSVEFLDADRVRIYLQIVSGQPTATVLEVLEWDFNAGPPRSLWQKRFEGDAWLRVHAPPSGNSLLLAVRTVGKGRALLLCPRDGGTPHTLLAKSNVAEALEGRLLDSGDLLILQQKGSAYELRHMSGTAALKGRWEIALPAGFSRDAIPSLRILGEADDRRVVLQWEARAALEGNPIQTLGLDLETGNIGPIADGVRLAPSVWKPEPRAEAGGLWSRLHRAKDGSLHLRQPDGGLKRLTAPD